MTIDEVDHEWAKGLAEKTGYIERLAAIKMTLLNKLPRDEYARVTAERAMVVTMLSRTERHLAELRVMKRKAGREHHEEMLSNRDSTPDFVRSIGAIRDEYQRFAAEHSRVASMRRMASEFANKLTAAIRAELKNKTEQTPHP